MNDHDRSTSGVELIRTAARCVLGAALVVAGIGHLGPQREEFHAQVPSWFPADPDLVVVSDAFELDSDAARFVRLLFQPVLALWALWSTGGWAWLRSRLRPASG